MMEFIQKVDFVLESQ